MNDYEVIPHRKKRKGLYNIPGQTAQLCQDIRAADAAGVSYGVYMGMKQSEAEEEYYKKFGVHTKKRKRNAS